ncbi:DinB family protein [Kribbella sp. NPDC054772]
MTAADPRTSRPPLADERTTMLAFLGWHRETLKLKCEGLEPADLARRSVGASALSLLGLVRHAADSERFWFRQVMAGADAAPLYPAQTAFDVTGASSETVAEAFRVWAEEVAFADRFVQEAASLDVTGNEPGEGPVSLRWVLTHMLEEYARHNGHADLLREQIDGAAGL